MPNVPANGIDIEYDEVGPGDGEPLLLVHGLGQQLVSWDDDFCRLLASHGFRVIVFDNRDAGLSTHFDDAPVPNVFAAMGGDHSSAAYSLDDMADDAAGLLDALGIAAAHVVGVSMGGMIAQLMAIRRPDLVLSLASISSTTGAPGVGAATPEAMATLLAPPPQTPEEAADWGVAAARTLGSPAYPFDEAALRERMPQLFGRGYDPLGVVRQGVAILAAADRTAALGGVSVPTLVVHGEVDPLIDVSGGRATAAAVPGAELLVFPGMGHDLPAALRPTIVDAIVANADRSHLRRQQVAGE